MYQEHKAFEVVPPETIVWQYMPLSKFICLLRKKELYFNRIDNFNDNTECTLTAIDKKYSVIQKKRNNIGKENVSDTILVVGLNLIMN